MLVNKAAKSHARIAPVKTLARTLLVWLVLLAIPFQGFASAAMLACAHGEAKAAARTADHHAHATTPPCHESSGQAEHAQAAASQDDGGQHGQHGSCGNCAACSVGATMAPAPHTPLKPCCPCSCCPATAPASVAAFDPDLPDRPPRTALA
ncbi:hypothetical protein [Massilia consociata]|uniref:CopL family metal-binding regulatory protein n=1 Tax=Massilia consociata TaxID=760117 RepID=A0ABV6FKH9_9BURK